MTDKPKQLLSKGLNEGAIPTSKLGAIRKDRYQRSFEISADQVVGMSKWLTASLFAGHSGGMLTVLNAAEKLSSPAIPGFIFGLGLVCALVSGVAIQELYNRISEPLADMIDYWAEVEAGAPENPQRHEAIVTEIDTINKWTWIAPLPGWISGLLFVGGAFSIALGFQSN